MMPIFLRNMYNYFFTVCETTYETVEFVEQVPKCETQMKEECLTLTDGSQEEVCQEIPKQTCEIENVTSEQQVPNTECKTMEHPQTVCGPKLCPLTKGDPVCEKKLKMVSLTSIFLSLA